MVFSLRKFGCEYKSKETLYLQSLFYSVVLKSEISKNFNEIVGEIERWVKF